MNFKGSGDLHKLWVRDILNKSLPIFTGKKGTSKADVAGSSLTGVFGSLGYTPPHPLKAPSVTEYSLNNSLLNKWQKFRQIIVLDGMLTVI